MSYTSQADPMQAMVNAMTPKFAVSYLRVSTRGQAERGGGADEGFSIPAQRESNKRKALSMGAMVGKELLTGVRPPSPLIARNCKRCCSTSRKTRIA